MLQQAVTIQNPRGIHLRPATLILEARRRYPNTQVWLSRPDDGQRVAPKSPLDLLALAMINGSRILLEVDGPQASECAAELSRLLSKTYEFK
ncbi:MAG: HPr family phosphocarrier protein [Victivallales bacterium]|nr:HPr family phosphocarrier protein [Victivallales bacterium]